MSWQATYWAWHDAPTLQTKAGKYDTTARAVLAAMAEMASEDKEKRFVADPTVQVAYPLLAELRYRTLFVIESISRALDRLEGAGLLAQVAVLESGVKVYGLNMEAKRPASDLEVIHQEVQRDVGTGEDVEALLDRLAATGRPFTADDVRAQLPDDNACLPRCCPR